MPDPATPRDSITIRGAEAARGAGGTPLRVVASRFRAQLGVPTDRPVIMTGHQAAFWHPGILAKYLAAESASRLVRGSPAWLVVDQDDPPADCTVHYAATAPGGALERREWDVSAPAGRPISDIPFVEAGLARIAAAWARYSAAPTPARRLAAVVGDLMAPLIPAAPTVFATELSRTDLFGRLVDAMGADPEGCTRAYNAAAAAHPSAGIRGLVADEVQDRYELPLWTLEPGEPRRRVHAEDLAATPRDHLAPRALLMTAMMRLAGCDVFIHGTGGGGNELHEGYDRVMEDWFNAWRPPALADLRAAPLAPSMTVTATRLLPLAAADPIPSPLDVAHADWLAHHARHDPAALGDPRAAAAKTELVERIADTPPATHARRELFDQMHRLLEQARFARADRLSSLEDAAALARARAAARDILLDRTWPFPLYPEATLRALQREIDAALGASR